jgi:hypothetical protein
VRFRVWGLGVKGFIHPTLLNPLIIGEVRFRVRDEALVFKGLGFRFERP